ncbi:ArsR/SmtB family transcription factor [Paenibacillus kobensis]|uniref:ArsR/SmtB family transcription factor n=1 Tax=Paenibacillus kobensis TaxID=59841 RepID=UPI000FD8B6FE|nr:metalloregulator ArsR/SmtB family transcription factor [Paenibacillus kobensis]
MNSSANEAVLQQFRNCSLIFVALGDPNRQDIIMKLAERGRLNVNQITEMIALSRPAVSHHLKILREAGILKADKLGKEKFYYLNLEHVMTEIKELFARMEQDCIHP